MKKGMPSQDVKPSDADFEKAKKLIEEGYEQVSASYRCLKKVPAGMTAYEALKEINPRAAKMVDERRESWAKSLLLRCTSEYEDEVEVTPEVFRAFKILNGPVCP